MSHPGKTPDATIIADYGCLIGENPIWHPFEKRLYWCDIGTGRIFRYDPATGRHEQCYQGTVVGGFTIQQDGALLLFMAGGAIARWENGDLSILLHGLEDELDSRFNDVIADSRGRVFCGTMSTPTRKGRLYRLDPDGSIRVVLEDVGCSNGMAFTADGKSFLHTDSFAYSIYQFDYDAATGAITNRRLFARLPESAGMPDGATLDSEGCLWSACWDGGSILRFTPTGEILKRIEISARKASSVTFGNEQYDTLYITTAGGENKAAEGEAAGALLRLDPGVHGRPEFLSRIEFVHASA